MATGIEESIRKRIASTEMLMSQIKDRTTYAYLEGMYSLKCDYEAVKDEENACKWAREITYKLSHNEIKYPDNKETRKKVNDMWVHSYDTLARSGDFEAFCIAMEWNRPVHQQFYLPRAKILKKHGAIQGIQDLIDDKLDLLVLNLPPRIGKELSNDTLVLTKDGWKTHGELSVGDYVLNDKGKFVKVLGESKQCLSEYVVTFANGEKIECHGNHEWVVYDRHAGHEKIVETRYMIGKLRDCGDSTHTHYRFSIPFKKPVKGIYKDLPVAPYTFGAWLGDGMNTNPYVSNPVFDKVIIDNIVKDGYSIHADWVHKTTGVHTVNFGGKLRFDLQKLGFCHSRYTVEKYIPDEYLTAGLKQRLDLLAGLLDTDGTLTRKEHRYKYSTTSKPLADSFITLVSTFGWRCSVQSHEPRVSTSNIQGKKQIYIIGFNPTFEIPCRVPRKQLKEFSKPRRTTIISIEPIKDVKWGKCIQVEGGVYLVGKTLIPTHNSTLGLMLQCLLGAISPDESILAAGHTAGLVQSFYSELLSLMTDPQYRYSEIFPNNRIVNKSAEYLYIDLNKKRRFHTYNYVSIETGGTGKVQAERLLYCDDLVKDVEQANNPDRLDKLYHNYTSTIKDRKIMRLCKDGKYRPCPEIHINTPWSLHDVTSRVVANAKEDDPSRVRIISVPCYDENGESNFMYDYGKGFSTKYYKDMEVAEDPVIFSAKYLMEPVERDGLLFNKDNITYYSELPGRKPDLVVAYQDVSHGGEDYFSMPVGYVYGNEVYIVDVLFRHKFGGNNYIRPLVRDMLIKYGVMKCGVERNNGGDFFSTLVIQDLRAAGYRCNVMDFAAPTNQSKLNRILAVQDDIKGIATINNTYRVYFKNLEDIKGNEDYTEAMHNLFKWNQNRNMQTKQHDDFPDSLAGLITNVLGESSKGVARSNIRAEELGL